MRAIHTWMLIAAMIFLGLAAGLSANAQEFRVKVTTKDAGTHYFGVTQDKRMVAIVCKFSVLETAWNFASTYSADLVFPTDDGVLNLENYREIYSSRNVNVPRSSYRPLPRAQAKEFCENPLGEYLFRITNETAEMTVLRDVTVQSFGVERHQL